VNNPLTFPQEEFDFLYVPVTLTSTINITLSSPSNSYHKGFKIYLVIVDNHAIAPNIVTNASNYPFSDLSTYHFDNNFGMDTSIFNNLVF
jgi:hypothetical protein